MVLEKPAATSTSPARLLALALAGLAGCYTVTFEEDRPEVYYCVEDSDCLASQACEQFRCVSDIGPELRLTLPEPRTLVTGSELTVDFSPTDFVISDSNQKVEGEGKVHISIDGGVIEQTVVTKGALVDISALGGGGHRVEIQAVYGDGTPYTNPSSYDHTAFFIEDENPDRPQVAILYPPPGYLHLAGEPLQVEVAVRNFALVDAGNDCKVPSDCDPFDAASPECVPSCEDPPSGHAHIYLIDNYPACLNNTPIGCNGDYVLSMRPSETNTSGAVVIGEVDSRFIDTTGPMQLTVSLQYNDHDPYPAKSFVIYDSIEIHVTE
ncbi:MAG: hypothetical protein R6X02_26835 [Enhygromyxa sp.]